MQAELDKLGWSGAELPAYAKGDARKLAIARRLRAEKAVTLKWIAAELHMDAWTYVSNLLGNTQQTDPVNQTELNLCQ